MKDKKSTEYLNEKLMTNTDIEYFLYNNEGDLKSSSFADALYQLLEDYQLKYAEIIKQAQLSESYGYQILNGRRQPSRDKVLQIALTGHFNLKETNRLLKLAGRSELYVKDKRDAVIMFALNRKLSLLDTEEILSEQNLEPIVS